MGTFSLAGYCTGREVICRIFFSFGDNFFSCKHLLIYLEFRVMEREAKKEGERERIFYQLIYPSKVCHLSSQSQELYLGLHVCTEMHTLLQTSLFFQVLHRVLNH